MPAPYLPLAQLYVALGLALRKLAHFDTVVLTLNILTLYLYTNSRLFSPGKSE